MGRWLRKDPDKRYFRHNDILAARPDMVEVSEEEVFGKTQEAPAQEQQAPAQEASDQTGPAEADNGAESNEGGGKGEPEDLAAYIDELDQDGLDAYAENHPMIGQRPKHNLSLENQRLWVKQMLGLEE